MDKGAITAKRVNQQTELSLCLYASYLAGDSDGHGHGSFIISTPLPLYTEVPDAPFNVTITNNSQRSQVLSWVAPFDGNRPITQYVIYVSSSRQPSLTQIHPPLGGGRTRRQTTGDSTNPVPSVTVTSDPNTVIVSDLIPFVEYSYTVEAINELGRSDMSQPSPFVRTEAAGESEEEQFIPIPLLDTSIMVVV